MKSLLYPLALALTLSGPLCVSAHAEMRALLVGVSSYPTLDKARQLLGPRNDVQRVRQVLEQRGFARDRITVLADGVPGAQQPTRANILRALETQALEARSGDTVVLYFAGHGSQQPADRKTPEGRLEPDGLHEIFLPIDVGRWDGQAGRVHNAIVDHELRAAVDQVLDRGAFVWGVFDACHSASLVRGGAESEVRYRHVSPEELGIDPQQIDSATADAMRTRGGATPDAGPLGETAFRAGRGHAVYFYAAQTTELTPELPLPLGGARREPYGLFSFMLNRALELGQPMSYRQLGQYILSQYGSINEARVTPLFAGTALDQAVLGQQQLSVRQWPMTEGKQTVPVGALSGIVEGALFAVVPGPLASTDEAIGYLRAQRVQVNQSELEAVAYGGKSVPTAAGLKAGSYARLVSNPEKYALRVAVDSRACPAKCPWDPVIERLRKDGVPGADVQWTTGGAEVTLKLLPDRIVALSPSEQGEVTCGKAGECKDIRRGTTLSTWESLRTSAAGAAVNDLTGALHAIARSRNLMMLATRLSAQSRDTGLAVTVQYLPRGSQTRRPITPERVPVLRAGDTVIVGLANQGPKALDVTLLYADARYGISVQYPLQAGEVNRLEPGSKIEIDDIGIQDTDGVVGIERLLAISVEAEKHGERADFSFLAQPTLKDVGLRTRGGPQSDEVQAFLDAGFADYATRGAPARMPGRRTGMQVFTFDIRANPAGKP